MTVAGGSVRVERRGVVLWLTVDRPARRNALSRDTLAEIGARLAAATDDEALAAAVVTGAGEEAFAAGGDLKELALVRSEEAAAEFFDCAAAALDEVRRFPVPVVAALNGVALGGGAELALACDYRVAADHAAIGYIQARLGISSGFGGGADLMRRIGPAAAMRLGLSARVLTAAEALALGVIDDVAGADEPLAAAVGRFLEPMVRQRPQVIRAYKALAIAERNKLPAEQQRAVEREWFVRTWTHPDHWAAVETLERKRRGGDR